MGPATTHPGAPPRVLVPWWRRPFVRVPRPTSPPLQRICHDLRRLEREAEHLMSDATVLARGQRLLAVRLAYDLVLVDACTVLEVPAPTARPPFTQAERLLTTVELARVGLRW